MNPDSVQWPDMCDLRAVTLTLQPIPNRVWIEQPRALEQQTRATQDHHAGIETATLHTHTPIMTCVHYAVNSTVSSNAQKRAQHP